MKKLSIFIILSVISCNPKTFTLKDKDYKKFFLDKEIKKGYKEGVLSKKPLVVINGVVFKYNENADTIAIPLNKGNIESINLLNGKSAKAIFNEGARGAVIINTFPTN